jgi:ubiquinone/menaquinone biosynthesis C-methylase UbiE
VYENEYVRILLGDSFHPGGAELTRKVGRVLGLSAADHVLDVASGSGTSAFVLANAFGCHVTGIDYSRKQVDEASAGNHPLCDFKQADAERLPFDAGSFDVVISECAFCTFPDKATAAAEMFRVLRRGGRLGLTDLTLLSDRMPDGLHNLLGIVACIGDARSSAEYRRILERAGFVDFVEQDESLLLVQLVERIKRKIDAARFAVAIGKVELGGMDLKSAREIAVLAKKTIEDRTAGYALLAARKPT